MWDLIVKIWFMIWILPVTLFQEGNERLANYLKEKNIYLHWDTWHSLLVVLVVILIVLLLNGYR